jgi:hypothetical protein
MEMYKNSISYSEKDLDFIGSLKSIRKLGSIDFSDFDPKWIDSMLSPFLVSKEQILVENALTVIECGFKGQSLRLAIVSRLCFDGYLMVFLDQGISWPLQKDIKSMQKFNLDLFNFNDWLCRAEENGIFSIWFSENNDIDKIDVDLMAKESFGFWKPYVKVLEPKPSLENIFSSNEKASVKVRDSAKHPDAPAVNLKTIDETLQYMSRSYAEFLYSRYVGFVTDFIGQNRSLFVFHATYCV